ncbi:YEATS domain containing 4 [Columba livia]|uniref:YEATS domain-containing protein 4 n=1 Tax=Columba livia TaxID=8932 RepID=A0A2I0LZP3_COLLI|nr:YEATS domain containing 4 [Columba livia]
MGANMREIGLVSSLEPGLCCLQLRLNHGSYRPTAAGGAMVAGSRGPSRCAIAPAEEPWHTLDAMGGGALESGLQAGSGCSSAEEFLGPSREWPQLGRPEATAGARSRDSPPPETEKSVTLESAQPTKLPHISAFWFVLPGRQRDEVLPKGVTIVKPIVYGNVARYFGKKREEDGHTHQWTVYVKPYRNEDMSAYVKKIQFKLHESYGNPLRVVTKPPYEITETGWGEFEIIIKIFFIDPNERPVTLYHLLKLFQSDTNAILGKKTVVSEFYDEMIFQDPTAMMQQLLTTSRQLTLGAYKHETEFADLEVKTREKLEAAKKKTSFEIAELKERLKASRETINCLKNEIRKLEEDDQSKDM